MSNDATSNDALICPVCQVKIEPRPGGYDIVHFSAGPPATRAKLWARVCQFVDKPDCINKDKGAIGSVGTNDYFKAELADSERTKPTPEA
jgi:hypothetical protein